MPNELLQKGIPSYLESPAAGNVQPPVETLESTLPCHLLKWEDFERLCVRLARQDSDIEHSQLYGVPGQAQEGIDLYARSISAKYQVYQCKRVARFSAGDIRNAVDKFLAGIWASRASEFILCTTESAVRTQQAEEYEQQAEILRCRKIQFVIWDRERVSEILRDQPRLVHDFFGKEWLRVFLGDAVVRTFGSRLGPGTVREFRTKLRQFYMAIFATQDPGIPIPPRPGLQSIPLADRFVPQDIFVDEMISSSDYRDKEQHRLGHNGPDAGPPQPEETKQAQPARRASYRRRELLGGWLARSAHSLITGGPGTGKSTLLRYLALEILSDQPTEERIVPMWAEFLPVYFPFAFWTKQVTDTDHCSLTECLRRWLNSWNEGQLWSLVQLALEDERLLLLVDGLDESSEDAGRVALQMLQVFVQTHRTAAVATSRPYFGLAVHGSEWQSGELAGLSEAQKTQLCSKWFHIRNRLEMERGGAITSSELLEQETRLFLRELADSADLEELSRVPLLLLLLVYSRFKNAILPRDRFEAYSTLVDYLVREHPATRRTASHVVASSVFLREREIRTILGKLAFDLQQSYPDGIIQSERLISLVEEFLNDPHGLRLGLGTSELRQYAEQFRRSVQDASGILVRQGVDAVSFLHRSLQEHLAALHIATMPMSDVIQIIEARVGDSRWREVILNLLWKIPRPDEIAQLIERLKCLVTASHTGLFIRELLTEAACSDINCPSDLARQLATEAIAQVENHEWLPHRRRLIRGLTCGLNGAKTKELVRNAFSRWAFRTGIWRAGWYEALAEWPMSSDVISALIISLNDEDSSVQRAAAESLAAVATGDKETGNVIASVARSSLNPIGRAAALRALSLGWKEHPSLMVLINDAIQSRSTGLQLTAIQAKVGLGSHNEEDFGRLLEVAKGDFHTGAPWGWKAEITWSLAHGWTGNSRLKQLCLEAAPRRFGQREHLDRDIAVSVLLQAFPQDRDVAEYCAHEIRTESFPFGVLHFDAWKLLSQNFRDNPLVVSTIDEWGPKQNQGREPELRYAALVGRTLTMKRKLLEMLGSSSLPSWPAYALLEGWGLDDRDVADGLSTTVYEQSARASGVAQFIPQVIRDPNSARERLLELLTDSPSRFPHLVIKGLASLTDRGDEREIVGQALRVRESLAGRFDDPHDLFDSELLLGFPNETEVRDLALSLCQHRNPPVPALAKSFAQHKQIRQKVLELVVSLPTALRTEVIDGLSKATADAGFGLATLERYDHESGCETKTLGSIAYHRSLLRQQKDSAPAIDRLSKTIAVYGHDYETRRQAAFAGLILMKRLDLTDQVERIGGGRPLSLHIEDKGEVNLSLLRLIAEHWSELHQAFGDNLAERIAPSGLSVRQLPEALALVAAQFPQLQQEVWGTNDEQVPLSTPVLTLLATVKPRSDTLKSRCLQAIARNERTWGGIERVSIAATILADNSAGDAEVRDQLVRGRPSYELSEGEIIALCAGWPDDPLIPELAEKLRRRHIQMSIYGAMSVLYANVPSSALVPNLLAHLDATEICNPYVYEALKRPVERRVRRDPEVCAAILSALREGATPSGKASLPRLLVGASGVTTELENWARGELERQFGTGIIPEIGFDLLEGALRAVALSLLDVLVL